MNKRGGISFFGKKQAAKNASIQDKSPKGNRDASYGEFLEEKKVKSPLNSGQMPDFSNVLPVKQDAHHI